MASLFDVSVSWLVDGCGFECKFVCFLSHPSVHIVMCMSKLPHIVSICFVGVCHVQWIRVAVVSTPGQHLCDKFFVCITSQVFVPASYCQHCVVNLFVHEEAHCRWAAHLPLGHG